MFLVANANAVLKEIDTVTAKAVNDGVNIRNYRSVWQYLNGQKESRMVFSLDEKSEIHWKIVKESYAVNGGGKHLGLVGDRLIIQSCLRNRETWGSRHTFKNYWQAGESPQCTYRH